MLKKLFYTILFISAATIVFSGWIYNPHTGRLDYYGVGVDETYGSGWNGDTGAPEKDDIYDYLHQIDTDDDGDVTNESWYTDLVGQTDITTQASTCTDSGDGNPGALTLTPTGSKRVLVALTVADEHGCAVTLGEGSASHGDHVRISNVSANSATFTYESGVFEANGGAGATYVVNQYGTISIDYVTDRWVLAANESSSAYLSTLTLPNTTSGDQTLTAAQIGLKTDEDLLVTHGGANGEVQAEVGLSLLQHIVIVADLSAYYDQETTYRALPIMTVGDDFPHGFTITELSLRAVGGDPTTELTNTDLYCDTTPDYNMAADATKMDDLDTSAGVFTEDSTFVSATCANGSFMYIDIGDDPTDANVVWIFEMWGYAEED